MKIIILKGPPASGKSTWARQQDPSKNILITQYSVSFMLRCFLQAYSEGKNVLIDIDDFELYENAFREAIHRYAKTEFKYFPDNTDKLNQSYYKLNPEPGRENELEQALNEAFPTIKIAKISKTNWHLPYASSDAEMEASLFTDLFANDLLENWNYVEKWKQWDGK